MKRKEEEFSLQEFLESLDPSSSSASPPEKEDLSLAEFLAATSSRSTLGEKIMKKLKKKMKRGRSEGVRKEPYCRFTQIHWNFDTANL